MPSRRTWFQDDASGRYRVRIEEVVLNGFSLSWRWYVFDVERQLAVVGTDIAHRDADAWSEAWAVVALCLAAQTSCPQGAYSIGTTGY